MRTLTIALMLAVSGPALACAPKPPLEPPPPERNTARQELEQRYKRMDLWKPSILQPWPGMEHADKMPMWYPAYERLLADIEGCMNVPPGGFATRQEDYECMVLRTRGLPSKYRFLKRGDQYPWWHEQQ